MNDVLVERRGGVLAITFNRPDRLNAITLDLVEGTATAIESADSGVRVITLTGAGRAFCAGADLGGIGEGTDAGLAAVNRLALVMRSAPQLVVALVNGPAAGVGSSFALGADLAVASDLGYLKTGFDAIGLMPDGGGTAYLAAALGRNRALATMILGDRIDAEEALRLGLFARVWPQADFADCSAAFVDSLAAGPTRAYAAMKQSVANLTMGILAEALEFERRMQRTLIASADSQEGVSAFLEKRAADFTGQ